ncbi:MAG: DEAD/DEAH box helicase, partial [Alphaproteobacteria bacterium]|nr:DEAD/DEAH box helicase [Alphaproteobacteria bacterium]
MQNFSELQLPEALNAALAAMNFSTPTPIQAKAIPSALEGKDILGSAQTGTGKTGAFGIPLVAHVMNNRNSMVLVLTPTRELASQVAKVVQQLLGHKSPIKTALLIGGDSMGKQMQQLKCKPRVIIGTPGRVNDHLSRRTLRLDDADMLVLDETDRMLDMGFGIQIDQILTFMPGERQTMMFSATLPKEIVAMSHRYMNMPVRISVGDSHTPTQNVEQEVIRIAEPAKYNELLNQLEKREGSIIVFVKTKYGAEKLAKKLIAENHNANAIHGDLRQHKREKVINAFRNKRHRIMVATDVASRGLDIPHIEHVINFDLPQCPEDYIHRIGRTARAGAKGQAVSLLAPGDSKKWAAIYRMLNPNEARPQREDSPKSGQRKRNKGFGGKGKPFGERKSFGDRKPYGERCASGERKEFGNKKPYGDRKRSESNAADGRSDRNSSFKGAKGKSTGKPDGFKKSFNKGKKPAGK